MLVFFDETTRHSCFQTLFTDVRFEWIRVHHAIYTRSFIGWRRIAVKKWLARYQRLTHPLIPRQTIGRAIVAGRRAADRRPMDRIVSPRPFTRPVSQFVDPFIWTEIRFSFGQYTALWLKLGQVYSFCEKGYIISSLRCFVGKLKAGGKTERTRTVRCNNFTFKFGEQIFLPFFASPLLFSFFFRVASWNWKKEIL